jgi:hypothetical protein
MIPSRSYVLANALAVTANGTGSIIVLPEDYSSVILALNTSAVGGTSPTLNVYIQECFRVPAAGDVADISVSAAPANYTVFDDVVAFAQVSGTGTQILRWTGGGNVIGTLTDAAMTTNSVKNGPIGQTWRLKWVLGGTSPTATFSVYGKFIF